MDTLPHYYAPRPTPRISEWFSESCTLFGREWKVWVLQGLLYLMLPLLPVVPGLLLCYAAFFRFLGQVAASSASSTGLPALPAELLSGLGLLLVGAIVSSVLAVYLLAGMTRTATKQLRGEPIAVGDLFTAGEVLLPDLAAYLLSTLALSFAFGLCFLPGLLLLGLWLYVHPLIVERRLSVMDAFRQSVAATKPHLGTYILWAVLVYLVFYAGSMVAVGIAATLPLAILMWVVSYRDTFGMEGALPPAVSHPAGMPSAAFGARTEGAVRRCPHCQQPVTTPAISCPACGSPL